MERYRYDAYGAATVLDADWSADGDGLSDVSSPYAFTGRRNDAESGLMQYRHRYYSALLGRFLSRDPAGYHDAANLNVFVGCRPTVLTDPNGDSLKVWLCRRACLLMIPIGAYQDCMAICDVMELGELMEDIQSDRDRCNRASSIDDCLACPGTGAIFYDHCGACCAKYAPNVAGDEYGKCTARCYEESKKKPPPGAHWCTQGKVD